MNIIEMIKTQGADKIILDLVQELKSKNEYIIVLEEKVKAFEANQVIMGTTVPAKATRKAKSTLEKIVDNTKKIQSAIPKIVSLKRNKAEDQIMVKDSIATVTCLQGYSNNNHIVLQWEVANVVDGLYSSEHYSKLGQWVLSTHSVDKYPTSAIIGKKLLSITDFNAEKYLALENCTSKDETRYNMNGILVDTENNKLVATDGRCLATMDCTIVTDNFIPSRGVSLSIANDETGLYKIATSLDIHANSESDAKYFSVAKGNGFTLYTSTVNGHYPNYNRVIPDSNRNNHIVIIVPSKEVLTEADKINKIDKTIGIRIYPNGNTTTENGKKVDTNLENSSDGIIRLDSKYLHKANVMGVSTLKGEQSSKSFIGNNENGYTFVVMPMGIHS